MPRSRVTATSTSTSFAVISICGVLESRSDAMRATVSTFCGRSVTISAFVRRSTWMLPRFDSAGCSGAPISAAFA